MLTLGVDIGSLTGKALVLEDDRIRAWDLILTGPDSVETGTTVTNSALAKAGVRLEELMKQRLTIPAEPQLVTALGAALIAADRASGGRS